MVNNLAICDKPRTSLFSGRSSRFSINLVFMNNEVVRMRKIQCIISPCVALGYSTAVNKYSNPFVDTLSITTFNGEYIKLRMRITIDTVLLQTSFVCHMNSLRALLIDYNIAISQMCSI